MPLDLDPRFTFESFVVGPANRLAAAAARRVADTPGTTYNPLFMYSASGLGKTHLLSAVGHRVESVHGARVLYLTLEHLMDEVSAALEAGERDVFRDRLLDTGLLLLDDVQFLAGQRQTQEELIRAWDALSARGSQIVLSSDRPPQEIDGLDDRLLSRLSGGLIVDIGTPDFETRVAIARRKAGERGYPIAPDVCQALARVAFTNVRELQGALNRLIAVQELEHRTVGPDEVVALLGAAAAERGQDEFGAFLSEIAGTVSALVEEADRRVADAILAWEGEGYRTRRLEGALAGTLTATQATELIRLFEHDIRRLRDIEAALAALEPAAPELSRADVLRDPDRVGEAEGLLAAVRARGKPPPEPPPGPRLDAYDGDSLAVRAARAVAADPGSAYNPLYVRGPAGERRADLLAAIGNELKGGRVVGYISGRDFAEEVIDALERGHLEAWRSRYRRAEVLLLDDLEALGDTERAQEELFHLFEDLQRAGRQLVFSASVPPHDLPLPERLRSRLEGGLVVELDVGELRAEPTARRPRRRGAAPPTPADTTPADTAGAPIGNAGSGDSPAGRPAGHWILSPEKVLWEWPYAEDWVQESVD
ncbi:MAG TPA: DnaA/Hda family protein [Longimicrobiales bacterium]|nr:DnaA/Hda family protein [Longimicrobiales bacterium]